MVFFVVEAQVEIPPVVNQRDEIGHQSAGGEAARGVAVPAPLVLEFTEAVLGGGGGAVGERFEAGGACHATDSHTGTPPGSAAAASFARIKLLM